MRHHTSNEPGRRSGEIFLGVIAVLSLGLDLLIYYHPAWFNHNSEYKWSALWHGRKAACVWVFLCWSLILGLAYAIWLKLTGFAGNRAKDAWSAILLFLLAVLSPLVFIQVNRFGTYELLIRVMVPDHTGYFTDAVRFRSKDELVKTYLTDWQKLSTHSRTHPPGTVLLFMEMNRLAERSGMIKRLYRWTVKDEVRQKLGMAFLSPSPAVAMLGAGAMLALWLMLFASALAALLGYFVLRRFYSAEMGFGSGLILASMPAFSQHTPVMDQVFADFILGSTLLALLGAGKRPALQALMMLAAGILIGAGMWLSPGVGAAALLIPILLAAQAKMRKRGSSAFQMGKEVAGAGFLVVLGAVLALWLGSKLIGAGWLEIYRINRLGWYFNNTVSGRVHAWKWILFNPYEFFFWTSFPVFAGILAKLFHELKKASSGEFRESADVFFWAVLVFMVVLNFSGQVCYESPRLCWFCLPMIAIIGATGLVRSMKNLHSFEKATFLGLVSLHTIFLVLIY